MHHPVASGPSGSICSQSRPVCAHFRVLCSQPTAEWEEVSTTSVPQLLSHSMGAVPLGHTKELSGTGSSYILLLPASKGAPLEHFCCRTLLLLQGEGGGCRTLKSYRQGFAFWRGTCNLPLPAACTPQPGVSAIPPSPGLPVLPCAAAPGSVGAALVTSSSSFFQHGPGYGAQQGRGNRE